MATVRQQVADQIRTDNPDHRVDHYPNVPSNVQASALYVDVYLTDLGRNDNDQIIHTLKLDCYASRTSGAEAEDEAETLRDDVLLSLQRMDNVQWSTAQRSSLGPDSQFIGYQITATVTTINVYARIIRQEP